MRFDRRLPEDARASGPAARQAEEAGYDGVWTTETNHDAFLPLVSGALATERIELGTAIAVAFARSPMTAAYAAHDLHALSGERFVLGLGSQIAPHVTRRFSMPWSRPAARMREFVLALRDIWRAWDEGEKLHFEGEFYRHTLMTPNFSPPPNATAPKVFVAGVGEAMTTVAGEVADGFLCHSFTTERYLRERTLPALEEGLRRSQRTRTDIEVAGTMFVATGATDAEIEHNVGVIRERVAFYASTPAYLPVLELHGWGDLQPALRDLTKQGRWSELADLVDDEVLDAFAVVAPLDDVAGGIARRFDGLLDRFGLYGESGDAASDLRLVRGDMDPPHPRP